MGGLFFLHGGPHRKLGFLQVSFQASKNTGFSTFSRIKWGFEKKGELYVFFLKTLSGSLRMNLGIYRIHLYYVALYYFFTNFLSFYS